jgi:hypothetical protein
MDELVHGGPTASGTPRTSAHSTPIKASARAEEVHDAIDQDTASQSTLAVRARSRSVLCAEEVLLPG